MEPNNGVLRTGLLAVGLTALFGLLIYQFRSSGLTAVVPHVVVGSYDNGGTEYSTVVQVVNVGSAPATVSARFFTEKGAPSPIAMTLTPGSGTTFTGEFSNLTVPGHGIVTIAAASAASFTALSGVITASTDVLISTLIEFRRGSTGELLGRVGLNTPDSNMRQFSIPRVRNSRLGLDTGFAIVNTGSSAAMLAATLYDASGSVVGSNTRKFAPHEHVSLFAREYFDLGEEPSTETQFQSIVFDSTSAQFAAAAFGIEGTMITNVPVQWIR